MVRRLLRPVTGFWAPEPLDATVAGKLKAGDRMDGGSTNLVVRSADDTIVKVYSRHPVMSFFLFCAELLMGRWNYPSRAERMRNEHALHQAIADTDLRAPDILYEGRVSLEFAEAPGTDLETYLAGSPPAESYRIGKRLAAILTDLWDDDVCLRDAQLSNFFLTDDGELYSIDNEYAATDPRPGYFSYTVIALFATARHLDPVRYRAFRDGFDAGSPHGDPVDELAAALVSLHKAVLRKKDPQIAKHAVYNSFKDFTASLRSIVDAFR